jgi:AraC-like DNA-binding protein
VDPGFGAVLRSLRLTSALLSRSHFRGRWGVIGSSSTGKMIFHGVATGGSYAAREGDGEVFHLKEGDVVIFTRGCEHRMMSAPDVPVIRVTDVPRRRDGATPLFEMGRTGDETRLVCGTFRLDHPAHASVVELLPPVIVGRARTDARRRWSAATLSLIAEGLAGSEPMSEITSLADSLFVSALVEAAEHPSPSGLFAAARDERIGRALALVHTEPATDWTAAKLAARVGMSRTRFFDLFAKLVGEPPARYVARWRALVAADLLRKKVLSTNEVAEHVGYCDEDALAKAFKRYMGMSPTEYRRMQTAS